GKCRFDLRNIRIKVKKYGLRDIKSADDQIFLCQETSGSARFSGDRRLRRDIPAADVLRQKFTDGREHLTILKPIHKFVSEKISELVYPFFAPNGSNIRPLSKINHKIHKKHGSDHSRS